MSMADYRSAVAEAEAQENRAIELVQWFARTHANELSWIMGWGDGRCGAIAEYMAEILIGPKPSRKGPLRIRNISASVRRAVQERDRYRCVKCGSHEALRIDHIHPWSRGGSNDVSNLQTLCHPCNQAKGARVEGGAA